MLQRFKSITLFVFVEKYIFSNINRTLPIFQSIHGTLADEIEPIFSIAIIIQASFNCVDNRYAIQKHNEHGNTIIIGSYTYLVSCLGLFTLHTDVRLVFLVISNTIIIMFNKTRAIIISCENNGSRKQAFALYKHTLRPTW